MDDPAVDPKVRDYVRRFADVLRRYKETNRDNFASSGLQMALVAVTVLKREIEDPRNKVATWGNPLGILPWKVNVDHRLNPRCIHIDPSELQDRKSATKAMTGHFLEVKIVDFLMEITRGVMIAHIGETYPVLYPAALSAEIQALPSDARADMERKLVDPDPVSLPIVFPSEEASGSLIPLLGSLQLKFVPLFVDAETDEAFYPIHVRLCLPNCDPETWSDRCKSLFWETLIEDLRGSSPREEFKYLAYMITGKRLAQVTVSEVADQEYAGELQALGQSYLTYQAKQRELTGKFAPLEISSKPDGVTRVLSQELKKDYDRYWYLRQDRIDIPGSGRKNRRNLILVNGDEARIPDYVFPLFLRLVVELKKKRGGWVSTERLYEERIAPEPPEYRPYQRLRDALGRTLSRAVADDLIQNLGEAKYRISTHPDFVTYQRSRLVEHPNGRIREVAKRLPRQRSASARRKP